MKDTYKNLLKLADEWIVEHKSEFISEIQALARIPSVSRIDLGELGAPFGPECRRVLDLALERGRYYGFETADLDGYAGSVTLGDSENSIGIIAHLDVVPEGGNWIYPPYDAVYLPENDALIGRGVDDNKGPAVAGLFAMRMLREFGHPLRHGIKLICGLSEETGMNDMNELSRRGYKFPKTSLVPDTSFPVNYGQKGSIDAMLTALCEGNLVSFDAGTVRNAIPDEAVCVISESIDTVRGAIAALDASDTSMLSISECPEGTKIIARGKAGHAAFPEGADNAIFRLARVLSLSGVLTGSSASAIKELASLTSDSFGRSEGVEYSDDISGALTLVYAVAHLKEGVLSVSVDCRYSITCDGDELEKTLRKNWSERGFKVSEYDSSKPYYIPKDDPRVTALMELYRDVTGRDDQPYTMGGGTYSRAVPNAISFGPGMRGVTVKNPVDLPIGHGGAHGPDEVLYMEKIYNASRIYVAALAMLDEIID